jgi:hypothetical protein
MYFVGLFFLFFVFFVLLFIEPMWLHSATDILNKKHISKRKQTMNAIKCSEQQENKMHTKTFELTTFNQK